ncbi:MAG: LamG-like jellyroll fold domain-containing protein, partial [Gammaproteobacteria bacterium]
AQYGSALSFDGVNDWVTVNDAAALDLTNGMTLSAWVYPTALNSWRRVAAKCVRQYGWIRFSGNRCQRRSDNRLNLAA